MINSVDYDGECFLGERGSEENDRDFVGATDERRTKGRGVVKRMISILSELRRKANTLKSNDNNNNNNNHHHHHHYHHYHSRYTGGRLTHRWFFRRVLFLKLKSKI